MKKILQLPNYYYPNLGGIEEIAREISLATKDEDITMKVLCFETEVSKGKENEYVDDVEIIRCRCQAKVASQSLSLEYGRRLLETINEYEPDIIILHYPNPFTVHFCLKHIRPETKLVLYWHSDIVKQKQLKKLFHRQTLMLLKRADIVVATSPDYIKGSHYLSLVKKKCIVIPNCLNETKMQLTEEIKQRADEIKRENEGKIICFTVGRHVEYKGFEYLIDASEYMNDNIVVYIGGAGPLTDDLKQRATGRDKVSFLGRIPDEEMIAYYYACDIFCFPSITKNEAFGVSLIEGMCYGKPAVTFTIEGSGVNFVSIDGVTGLQCKNSDAREYATAVNTLAEDERLAQELGENAARRVKDMFTFASFKKNILEMLTRL